MMSSASIRSRLCIVPLTALLALSLPVSRLAADPPPVYGIVSDWPALPDGKGLGQVVGVAVDAHNHVFVFHRAGRTWTEPFPVEAIQSPTLMMLDADSGKPLKEWGGGRFVMPHGLSVDAGNNVWVSDVGTQQVHKFDHDGNLLLSLGEAGVQGSDQGHFALPTDIAFLGDGTVLISDGYVNTRVVAFSPTGEYLSEFGEPGDAPGAFDLPHGISTGTDGRIYVADRSNSRIQVFDSGFHFIDEWRGPDIGRAYGVDALDNGMVFVVDGGDQPDKTSARALLLNATGEIQRVVDTRRAGETRVLGHDIAVGPDGAVYLADAWADRIVKISAIGPE